MDYIQIEKIKQRLKETLPENTYNHILRTVWMAMELCTGRDADRDTVFMAALLHDCAKKRIPTEQQWKLLEDFREYPKVVHAPLGAIVAKEEYGITDEKILSAIKYHTTGRPGMTLEEMIVFLADAIEDGRDYDNVDNIRQKTKISIELGVLESLKGVLNFEGENKNKIHHLTADTIEYLKGKINEFN